MEALLPQVPARFIVPRGQTFGDGPRASVFAGCIMSTAFAPNHRSDRAAGRGIRQPGRTDREPGLLWCAPGALGRRGAGARAGST